MAANSQVLQQGYLKIKELKRIINKMLSICDAVKNNSHLSRLVGLHIPITELMDNLASLEADGRRTDNGKLELIEQYCINAGARSDVQPDLEETLQPLEQWFRNQLTVKQREDVLMRLAGIKMEVDGEMNAGFLMDLAREPS